MHLPNEGVLDLFQYFNFCFIGIVGPLQRGIRVGRGAPDDHRGRSLDWSVRNLGSEKLCWLYCLLAGGTDQECEDLWHQSLWASHAQIRIPHHPAIAGHRCPRNTNLELLILETGLDRLAQRK